MSPSLVLSGVEKYGDRTTKKQESHPALKAGQFAFGKVELWRANPSAVDHECLAIGALLSFSAKARMHHQPERPIFTRKPIIPDSNMPPVPRQIASQVLIAGGSINYAILVKQSCDSIALKDRPSRIFVQHLRHLCFPNMPD